MKKVSELLLCQGTGFYRLGRITIKWFLTIGLGIIALIMLFAGDYRLGYLALNGHYAIVNILMVLGYLGTLIGLIGVSFYFIGLHYMGLGQIAKNTEEKAVESDELPEL